MAGQPAHTQPGIGFMLLDERSGWKGPPPAQCGHSGTIRWFKNSLQVSDGQGHRCLTVSGAIMTAIKEKGKN